MDITPVFGTVIGGSNPSGSTEINMKTFYKKIDHSMMNWGVIIPRENEEKFLFGEKMKINSSREISISWDKKKYKISIRYQYHPVSKYYYELRWDSNKDFLNRFKKTFIHSFITIKSQKELFDNNKNKKNKIFRTKLNEGQEVCIFTANKKTKEIDFSVFIKIEDKWNTLFQRLLEENVFDFIFDNKDKEYLIQKSTNWIDVKDFNKHKNALNVIYYLADSKNKLLYVGKAKNLGRRVVPRRKHQEMPETWDTFKYDIIRPEFSNLLERIEDHTIRTIASILQNTKKYNSLKIGNYKLVNSQWKKL